VPFSAPYRPLWVGIGVIGFYLTLLVTITFYMRRRIGMKVFRMIHLLSFVSYVFAAMHGLMAGTDSVLPAAQLMYAATTLVVVFLTAYWVAMLLLNKRPQGLVRGTPHTVQ
jgi:sulfoxide reductase heme-binding subunit YedZ